MDSSFVGVWLTAAVEKRSGGAMREENLFIPGTDPSRKPMRSRPSPGLVFEMRPRIRRIFASVPLDMGQDSGIYPGAFSAIFGLPRTLSEILILA